MKTEINEKALDSIIDDLMIERGEHPSRVRNPIYGEERQLAKDTFYRMLETYIIKISHPENNTSQAAGAQLAYIRKCVCKRL